MADDVIEPPSELAALNQVSAVVGGDIRQVQGGGGNASLKTEGRLWIKASGTWLGDAAERKIFVPLDLEGVRQGIRAHAPDPTAGNVLGGTELRPSIETSLHALLPHRLVMHTHSVNAIAWAVRPDAQERLKKPLDGVNWAWVPYARPGLPLTHETMQSLNGRDTVPDVLVLQNHGLVVGASNTSELQAMLNDLERRLWVHERERPDFDQSRLEAAAGDDQRWRLPADPGLHALALDEDCLNIANGGVLYPDHVVFLGSAFPWVSAGNIADANFDVPYLVVENVGTLVSLKISAGAEAMLQCLGLVTRRLESKQEIRYLSEDDIDSLINWDAEAYRQSIDQKRQ